METVGLNFLVVEDEVIVMESLKVFLNELGHQVIGEAYSGEEAIELMNYIVPDMILMDINMPGINGITTLNRISEQHFLPCIFITGYSDPLTIESATATNAFGYLIKPIDKAELHAAILIAVKRYTEQCAAEQEAQRAKSALNDRKLIERAKGILMTNLRLNEQQAMQFLQKRSRDSNVKLVDVAQQIIKTGSGS